VETGIFAFQWLQAYVKGLWKMTCAVNCFALSGNVTLTVKFISDNCEVLTWNINKNLILKFCEE
jgi:hypothetical protein